MPPDLTKNGDELLVNALIYAMGDEVYDILRSVKLSESSVHLSCLDLFP